MELYSDEYFMKQALAQAQMAFDAEEVPVGCVVVHQNKIIGRGHNLTERLKDVTAHAEMQAITAAAAHIGGKYLVDCTIYVTLEPCVMCAGAIFWSQAAKLVIGAADPKRGFLKEGAHLLHPKTTLVQGIEQEACSELLKTFFKKLRE